MIAVIEGVFGVVRERVLPRLAPVFARLPRQPPAFIGAVALNVLLQDVFRDPVLEVARGRTIRVGITDLGLTLDYRLSDTGLTMGTGDPDVTLIATSDTFRMLAEGQEDADTLFFNRRLEMRGDTELGLLLRNALDATDRSKLLRPRVPSPGEMMSALKCAAGLPEHRR